MARRPDKTIIDYLIIAICPILIGLMAGSLAFFLLECSYTGRHEDRARWIVGLFVLAMVGIARISIELSKGRAIVYGSIIAIEVLVVTNILEPAAQPIMLFIIVVTWFGIHKLTWSCTFIDEQQEDVGRGLLESAEDEDEQESTTRKRSLWRRWLSWSYIWSLLGGEQRCHAPGAWIVYFAVIAVPMFTIAQWSIPLDKQEAALDYVTIYLLSAMSLLVATSLLGLRRYLRRRRMPMPKKMAIAWLTLGAILIVVCIGFATFMPRPTGTVSERLASIRKSLSFKESSDQASRRALGKDGAEENDDLAEREGESDQDDGSSGSKSSKSSPDEKSGSKNSNSGKSDTQAGGNKLSNVFTFLRWIVIVVVIGILLFWSFKHRRELLVALREIFESFRDFIANLFGRSARREKREQKKAEAKTFETPQRLFPGMVDPFSSGKANQMQPQELVKYTFEAIETWASDLKNPRQENETPHEFLLRVDHKTKVPSASLRALDASYSSTTYDTLIDTPELRAILLDHLETIWRSMRSVV